MTTTTEKNPKNRQTKKASHLPPIADVVKISGREYVIAPLDEFREWEEDKALKELMAERLEDNGPYISLEEFEKHLFRKAKGRKK